MAKSLIRSARNNLNVTASTTNYYVLPPTSINGGDTVESTIQTTARTAGIYSQLYALIVENDRATSTLRFRKNTANGNMALSISGTGEFTDLSSTDTVASGDLVNLQIVSGAGGTRFVSQSYGVTFRPDIGTVISHSSMPGNFSTASTTAFSTLAGQSTWTTTEADAQWKSKVAGTCRNFGIMIESNARTTATTFGSRIAGVNGNMSVSVPGTPGSAWYEDISNSDAISYDTTMGYYITTGTGTGTIGMSFIRMEFYTVNNYFQLMGSSNTAVTVNASTTTNFPISGRIEAEPTESEIQITARIPIRLSNLQCYITGNTVSATSTIRLRKNGANGNLAVSITGSTNNWFEDLTGAVDEIAPTDKINYQIVTGASGTSLGVRMVGCLAYSKVPRFFFGA